ncbi:zinc finger, CCHC-type containing protein [Tanacetum coccineum]
MKCEALHYKLDGETKCCMIYDTYETEDGWFVVPLYQFTSYHKTVDFEIEFEVFQSSCKLQVASFEFQPLEDKVELHAHRLEEYKDIVKAASQSLFYKSIEELKELLSKGFHINNHKTWFSLNENEEHCEMLSIAHCLNSPKGGYSFYHDERYSRYKLEGETESSIVYLANETKDNHSYIAELYQFTSNGRTFDLDIVFKDHTDDLEVEGILLQPLEKRYNERKWRYFKKGNNKKDKTAIAFLYQALPEEQLLQITKHKTAKTIWDALKTRHIGEERVQQARLQTLKSEFEMLHMKEDETIDTFTAKLTTIVNKAASLGHTMEDETLVRKLLNVVPDRYLQIVASIEQYSDLDEMTLEEAIGRLKTYEERIKYKKGKQVDNQEKLMFTRHENKGKYFRGRGRGKHKFSQGRNHENFKEERKDGENSHKNYKRDNFKKSSYDTSKLQCYKCKKIGHIAPKCPQRTKPNEQSNLVEEDLEPTLLMAILEDEEQKVSLHEEDVGYKETNMDSLWYLDNGASNHMTGVREHFKELDEKVSGKVRFGDGSYIEIKGKGSILIECDDEKQRIISHVYYIPDLKSNLLSLGQFTEIGCKVVMEDDELRLYDMDNKIFMKVTRLRNRLYKANLRIGTPVCLLANLKEDNEFPNNDDDDHKHYKRSKQ